MFAQVRIQGNFKVECLVEIDRSCGRLDAARNTDEIQYTME